mgnify:CR=1 FL=1
MSLLDIQNLTVQFGGLKAISNVYLSLDAGQMVGLIGPNGAGKTTLFNTVTGVVQKTEGSVLWKGSFQIQAEPDCTPGNQPYISEHPSVLQDDS